MSRHFCKDGLTFVYPEEWNVSEEPDEYGWTATVQSPGTAFLLVRLDKLMNAQEDTARAALDALKDDYPALEAKSVVEAFAGEMAIGHDIEFFSLDVPVICWTRSFYGLAGTMMVMGQCSAVEKEDYEAALRGICSTMRLEEEEEVVAE